MPASTLVRCGYRCQGLEDDAVEVARFKNDGRVVRLISVISADAPFDPPETGPGQRKEQTDAVWCSTRKSHLVFFFRVGELPETENESWEDTDPPKRKMPAKVRLGNAQVGFCPCGRILFRGSTVACRLGCWSADCTPSNESLSQTQR
jgi:hypothetical protein